MTDLHGLLIASQGDMVVRKHQEKPCKFCKLCWYLL